MELSDTIELNEADFATVMRNGGWRRGRGTVPILARLLIERADRGRRDETGIIFADIAESLLIEINNLVGADPLMAAYEAIHESSGEVLEAAEQDVADALEQLDESLPKATFSITPQLKAGKILWPVALVYFILAVEDKAILKEYNEGMKNPAFKGVIPLTAMNDALNALRCYFHPHGARYEDSDAAVKGKDYAGKNNPYAGLSARIMEYAHAAFMHHTIPIAKLKHDLELARKWLTIKKKCGPVFHTIMSLWQKKDYAKILAYIPEASDIYPFFKQFVAVPPIAPLAVDLAQSGKNMATAQPTTIAPTQEKISAAKAAAEEEANEKLKDAKIENSQASSVMNKKFASPLTAGAMVEFDFESGQQTMRTIAAFTDSEDDYWIVFEQKDGSFLALVDKTMVDAIVDGQMRLKGRRESDAKVIDPKELLADEPEDTTPDEPMTEPLVSFDPVNAKDAEEYFGIKYADNADQWVAFPIPQTDSAASLSNSFGYNFKAGSILKMTYATGAASTFKFDDCWLDSNSGKTILIYQASDGLFHDIADGELQTLINQGKIAPALQGDIDKVSIFKSKVKPSPVVTTPPPAEITVKYHKGDVLVSNKYGGGWYYLLEDYNKDSKFVTLWNMQLNVQGKFESVAPAVLENYTYQGAPGTVGWGSIVEKWLKITFNAGSITSVMTTNIAGNYWTYLGTFGVAADLVMGMRFVPVSPYGDTPQFMSMSLEAWNAAGIGASKPASKLKFKVGDVFKTSSPSPWLVLDVDEAGKKYTVVRLVPVSDLKDAAAYPQNSGNESGWTFMGHIANPGNHLEYIPFLGKQVSVQEEWGVHTDETVQIEGQNWTLLSAVMQYGKIKPVLFSVMVQDGAAYGIKYPALWSPDASIFKGKVTSSYEPHGADDEPSLEDTPKDQEYPKLNYHLSSKAKEIAKEHQLIYVPSPKDAPFFVGSSVIDGNGDVRKLLAWIMQAGEVRAVLSGSNDDAQDDTSYYDVAQSTLATAYSPKFMHKSQLSFDAAIGEIIGDVVFGKGADSDKVKLEGIKPYSLEAELLTADNVAKIKQPPFEDLNPGQKVSAGVVVVMPANTTMYTQVEGAEPYVVSTKVPSFLMVHPLNEFNGTKLTFPKGTVEKGEAIAAAAVREVFEETGMYVNLTGLLGDFKSDDSDTINRYFMGYVMCGDPNKAGTGKNPFTGKQIKNETDAVTLRMLMPTWVNDKNVPKEVFSASTAEWFKELGERDKAVASKAATWINDHGLPTMYVIPDVADQHYAVSSVKDTAHSPRPGEPIPAGTAESPFQPLLKQSVLAVNADAFEKLVQLVSAADWASPKSFKVTRTSMDCPAKAGDLFTISGIDEKFTCYGYLQIQFAFAGTKTLMLKRGIVANSFGWYLVPASQIITVITLDASAYPLFSCSSPSNKALFSVISQTTEKLGKKDLAALGNALAEEGISAGKYVTPDLAVMAAKMFLPSSLSSSQTKYVLAQLAHKASVAGYTGVKTPVEDTTQEKEDEALAYFGVKPSPVIQVVTKAPPYYNSPDMLEIMDQLTPDTMTKGAVAPGGSNKAWFYSGPQDTKWRVKYPKDNNPARGLGEEAASKMCALLKSPLVPSRSIKLDGQTVNVQPVLTPDGSVPGDPNDFSDENKVALLRQHVIDMWMTDHDAGSANYLMVKGRLIPIDRGQSFKFYAQNQKTTLDPNWVPAGVANKGLAKALLVGWSLETKKIPDKAFAAMHRQCLAIGALKDDAIMGALKAYLAGGQQADGTPFSDADKKRIVKQLIEARTSIADDWLKVLKKLKPGFDWPPDGLSEKVPVFDFSVGEMGFTEKDTQAVEVVSKVGWYGKSLRIDAAAIENQEVMVRQVNYATSDPNAPKVATLIHFRVNNYAAKIAEDKLYAETKGVMEDADTPMPLSIDNANGQYWGMVVKSIKTINHHLFQKKDVAFKPEKLAALFALKFGSSANIPDNLKVLWDKDKGPHALPVLPSAPVVVSPSLPELIQMTADAKGQYKPPLGGVSLSNASVQAMATKYLDIVNLSIDLLTNITKVMGKSEFATETFNQFVWLEPKKKEKPKPEIKQTAVKVTTLSSSVSPHTSAAYDAASKGGVVSISADVVTPQYKGGLNSQNQFRIEVPGVPGAVLYYNPARKAGGGGEHQLKSYLGQAWGMIPGEVSLARIATLVKAFEVATGLDMSAATDEDQEILMLSKNAYAMQSSVSPGNFMAPGEGVVDQPFKQALGLYRQGKKAEAKIALTNYVVDRLNEQGVGGVKGKKKVTADTLSMLENYGVQQYTPVELPGGEKVEAGWARPLRIGWTRAKLIKYLGDPLYAAHAITSSGSVESFWKSVTTGNGCLLANVVKPYYGVPMAGSAGSDIPAGSTYIFLGIRRKLMQQSDVLYFDPSLFLRTDVVVIGSGDGFGRVYVEDRYVNPESWKPHLKTVGMSNSVGTSSSFQLCVMHDIDLRQYLHSCLVASDANVYAVKKQISDLWGSDCTFAQGRTLDQVIRRVGDGVP